MFLQKDEVIYTFHIKANLNLNLKNIYFKFLNFLPTFSNLLI